MHDTQVGRITIFLKLACYYYYYYYYYYYHSVQ